MHIHKNRGGTYYLLRDLFYQEVQCGYPFYRLRKWNIQSDCSSTFWWEIVHDGPWVWNSSYTKSECYGIWVVYLSLHRLKCWDKDASQLDLILVLVLNKVNLRWPHYLSKGNAAKTLWSHCLPLQGSYFSLQGRLALNVHRSAVISICLPAATSL